MNANGVDELDADRHLVTRLGVLQNKQPTHTLIFATVFFFCERSPFTPKKKPKKEVDRLCLTHQTSNSDYDDTTKKSLRIRFPSAKKDLLRIKNSFVIGTAVINTHIF